MPSLAVTQPYAPRALDLIDATDRSYRQIESAYAGALQIQSALFQLQNPVDGVASHGEYFMPSSVSAANRVVYEALVNAAVGTPEAVAGVRTSDVVFTPDTSPVWPVNGLVGKGLYVKSYVAGAEAEFAVSAIASNTATAVTITGALLAAADTIELVSLTGQEVVLLNSMMTLT